MGSLAPHPSENELSVAVDSAGNFVYCVETHEFSSTGGDDDIRIRRFDANGNPLTSSDQIIAQPSGDQDEPAIALFTTETLAACSLMRTVEEEVVKPKWRHFRLTSD